MPKQSFDFGKLYRIELSGLTNAIYDSYIQGKTVKLTGWAKNLTADTKYKPRQIEALLQFYQNRAFPDHDEFNEEMLENAVYGVLQHDMDEFCAEDLYMDTVILRQSEFSEI